MLKILQSEIIHLRKWLARCSADFKSMRDGKGKRSCFIADGLTPEKREARWPVRLGHVRG
jgi:hypothetical protein